VLRRAIKDENVTGWLSATRSGLLIGIPFQPGATTPVLRLNRFSTVSPSAAVAG
jgi:hypothetical protein